MRPELIQLFRYFYFEHPIEFYGEKFTSLGKWGFVNPKFQNLYNRIVERGTLTSLEYQELNLERLKDIQNELQKRKANNLNEEPTF